MTTTATEKQMKYLRDLVTRAGEDINTFLIDRGISKLDGYPTAVIVAARPSKDQASRFIEELAGPSRRSRPARNPRFRGFVRCTHEDYPACGCAPDVWAGGM